jgi:uncharacterized protein (TIGR00730 family)
MKSVCVFCGSNVGRDAAYLEAAITAGEVIARSGLAIVYGGGRIGLMGAVADAALAAGGRVVGVMPRALFEREIAHSGLSELRVVETMHERNRRWRISPTAFSRSPAGPVRLRSCSSSGPGHSLAFTQNPAGFSM